MAPPQLGDVMQLPVELVAMNVVMDEGAARVRIRQLTERCSRLHNDVVRLLDEVQGHEWDVRHASHHMRPCHMAQLRRKTEQLGVRKHLIALASEEAMTLRAIHGSM
jgi:hypothetical protein